MILDKAKIVFPSLLLFSAVFLLPSLLCGQMPDIIVDHSSGNVHAPQIAADGNGNVYTVWEDTRNGSSDIYFNYSTDYGFTWQDTDIRIDTDVSGASHSRRPQIACDSNGHVYIVWEDERNGGTDIYFNYSSDFGITWQGSDRKMNSVLYALIPQYPKVTCDNSGHVYVAWDDNYFNTCTIDINGIANCLSEAIRISATGGVETELTCDQNGHVYVAWRTSDILFNYSSDFGNSWQSDITISDTDPVHAIPYGLSLNSNESGNVYFAWDDGRNSTDLPDVYFNSCSNYGSICRASPDIRPDIRLNTGTPGPTYSIWPVIACDENGSVYVAWYDKRNLVGDIYLNYYDYNTNNWQASDIRLDTDSPSADSGYPKISSDNNGHACVIWIDNQQDTGPGLYMNYSLNHGVNWLSENRKIGSGGINPQMVTDGNRFYIVWDNGDIVFNEMAPADVPPFPPADPSPVNGAAQVSLTPLLSWRGGDANLDDTLTYDVYLDISSPPQQLVSPNQTATTYTQVTPLSYLTTYYWQVVAKDSTGAQTAGPIWSFTTISGPPYFVDFSPPAGATGVGRMPTLSWTAIDPDPGDTLTYAVYFGKTNPPPLQTTSYTSNTYNPGLLSHYTVYYWKIVAKDNHGTLTTGPILSFTTINNPPQFNTYSPVDGATGIELDDHYHSTLKWSASDADGDDTIKYDIYFGTSSPPPLVASNQTVTSYYTGPLTHMTVYYWKIVARDNHGAETELPVLSFTTLNNKPVFLRHLPTIDTPGVDPSPTLQWSVYDPDPDDTLTYDVYFGTSSSPPLVRSHQTKTSYTPGQLSYSTRYYWMVVAHDPHGAEATVDVLYFTTAASDYPELSNFFPEDKASGIGSKPTLSWSGSDPNLGDTLTYDVYFGYSSPPPKKVSNQAATTYQPGTLAPYKVYYWKIVARDNHGVERVGPILSFSTLNRPPQIQSFTPSNLSTGVSPGVTLKWSASDPDFYDTVSCNIYFGTSSPPPLVAIKNTTGTYKPAGLLPLTEYYWKIVAYDESGAETIGPELSFTTGNPPTIQSISPKPCQTLQVISIFGELFRDTQGTSEIHLGSLVFRSGSIRIKMWSDTRIDFQIPPFTALSSGKTVKRYLWVKVNGLISNKVLVTIRKP